MIEADKGDFVKTLLGLAAIKPGKPLSPEAYEIWWLTMIKTWNFDDFRAVALSLAGSMEFMPTPYHFEQCRKAAMGCSADAAWEQIIHEHGECRDVVGARALRSLGGWRVVGFVKSDQLPWLKERFREAYENFESSAVAAEAFPQIAGSAERLRLEIKDSFSGGAALIRTEKSDG